MPPRKRTASAVAADDADDSTTTTTTTTTASGRPKRGAAAVAAAAVAAAALSDTTTKADGSTKRKRGKAAAADDDDDDDGSAATAAAAAPVAAPSKGNKRAKKSDVSAAVAAVAAVAAPASPAVPVAAVAAAPAPSSASSASTLTKTTIVKKGSAPVDSSCPVKNNTHVYEEAKDVFDVMLNQTDVGYNVKGHNKYYVIQLLQTDDGKDFYCWQRWGRVGNAGQNALKGPTTLASAKAEFYDKFRSKTSNSFDNRASFKHVSGKYDLIKLDYEATDEPEEDTKKAKEEKGKAPAEKKEPPASKLAKPVQTLMELIFNVKAMEETVMEMNYDTKKAPLGKLSKDQIKAGLQALKEIAELVSKGQTNSADLKELNNQYYTKIPHDFGMNRPTIINSNALVDRELKLLEALGEIEIAMKVLKSSGDASVNPIDSHYDSLKCAMNPIEHGKNEWNVIEEYIKNTHAATHANYSLDLEDVFEIGRDGESERFKKDIDNHQLLWHGSRLTNFVGILSQGLRIAPPEAPVTGYMFGKGVYFADMVSKSANYCFTNKSNNTGILLLCEVALGKPNELQNSKYDADKLPAGCKSTKGLGKTIPDPAHTTELFGNVKVPYGKGIQSTQIEAKNSVLQYNEFIVYDVSQIRIRYLLKVKFNYKY